MTEIRAILVDVGRRYIRYGLLTKDWEIANLEKRKADGDLIDMITAYAANMGIKAAECQIAIAAPGPFQGKIFRWGGPKTQTKISIDDVKERLSPESTIVHDVIAGGLSVLVLADDHVSPLYTPPSSAHQGKSRELNSDDRRPIAYIQTGVGLGLSALMPTSAGKWDMRSGEGGSMSIGLPLLEVSPNNFSEFSTDVRILNGIRNRRDDPEGWGYPTAQHMLSATTLPYIYNDILKGPVADVTSEDITDLASKGDDIARETILSFARFLGVFAADAVMAFRANDGLFIGGPIPPKFDSEAVDAFCQSFLSRGSASNQLKETPVHVVNFEYNSLLGLATMLNRIDNDVQ